LLTGAAPGRPRPGACRHANRGSAAAAGDRRLSTRRTRSGRPARAGSSASRGGSVAHRRTAIRASPARAAGRRGRGASPRCTRSGVGAGEVRGRARLEPHLDAALARDAALTIELALEQPVVSEVATVGQGRQHQRDRHGWHRPRRTAKPRTQRSVTAASTSTDKRTCAVANRPDETPHGHGVLILRADEVICRRRESRAGKAGFVSSQ